MNIATLLLIVLIVVLVVGAPQVGLHNYGWGPSGIAGVIVLVLLILLLTGRL